MALALSHGFAGVFSHLQGAVRETRLRPSRCLHERCGIATNATANPWRRACGRAASRPATERAFLGIVATGSDLPIRSHRRYSAASVNSPSMTSRVALSALRALASLYEARSLSAALRRHS